MRGSFLFALIAVQTLAACAQPASNLPSLAPRAAEAIDPRVPLPSDPVAVPADAALRTRIEALVSAGLGGQAAFDQAIVVAERLAGGAGGPGSESWIQAQEALSAAVAARASTARALADIDALAAQTLQARGDLPPGDLAALQAASATVSAVDAAQNRRVHALQIRLGA